MMTATIAICPDYVQAMRDAVEVFSDDGVKIVKEEVLLFPSNLSVFVELEYNTPNELFHVGVLYHSFQASVKKEVA